MRKDTNITMIDDLPYLDDLELPKGNGGGVMAQDFHRGADINVNKFIRNHGHNTPMESGMQIKEQPLIIHRPLQQQLQPQKPFIQQQNFVENEEIILEPQNHNHFVNCVSVSEHATNCVVCSRLYACDKTAYVIVIVVLLIICILLVKRILEK